MLRRATILRHSISRGCKTYILRQASSGFTDYFEIPDDRILCFGVYDKGIKVDSGKLEEYEKS